LTRSRKLRSRPLPQAGEVKRGCRYPLAALELHQRHASNMPMASTAPRYDVAIIGAGHNGLTCAAYLARKGYRVKIVERRGVVGGAAVTEEFHPGFRNSVCSYVVSLLDPKIIRDLELEKYGLTILERPSGSLSLLPDGRFLRLARELEDAEREIGKFSQ